MALIAAHNEQSRAQTMAQRLIAWADLRPPIDVEAAARCLGIDVETLPLSGSVAGMLVQEEPGRWLIVVNTRITDPGRRRFTIAHELGHWTLHRPQLKWSSLDLATRWEEEANEFASHLLMPPVLLQEQIRLFGLVDIERRFGVSRAAAAAACRRLGYQVWA